MKINILHMGFFYSGGGERVALEQTKRLRERGHQVKLLAPIIRPDRCYPRLLREVNPEHLITPVPTPIMKEALSMIMCAALPIGYEKLGNCDVILCHSQPSMWIGYKMNQLTGIPYVGYLHQLTTFIHSRPKVAGNWSTKGDFMLLDGLLGKFGRPIARTLDHLCHSKANKLIFNSQWTKQMFKEKYGLTGTVCYPGITTGPVHLENSQRKNMMLTASRHYPWKRIDLAFAAMRHLSVPIPQFMVLGESTSHTPQLKQAVREYELEDYVNFTGHVTDTMLNHFFTQSAAYVQTSVREPFGMGPLEAQACGTPAVVWADGGVKETVIDGETGFLANPYDIPDFADKLSYLLSIRNTAEWWQMSREAQIWASSFSWDSHVDTIENELAAAT